MLSPNDLRATLATRVEPDEIAQFQQVEVWKIAHDETTVKVGTSGSRGYSARLRFGASAGGTSNRLADDAAQQDPDTALRPRDGAGPTPIGGANAARTLYDATGAAKVSVSFTASSVFVPKATMGYVYRLSGRVTQAVELMKNRGLVLPGPWKTRFRGWTARVADLVSGYITARDAQEAGIVRDRVVESGDGTTLDLSPQPNPADITDVRVRPGFEGSGKRVRPADPTRALSTLVERLAARGYEFTAGGRERLLEALTTRLGNTSGTSEPVDVRIRRRDGSGDPRSGGVSHDARVLVDLRTRAGKVEYLAASDVVLESHTWKVETGGSTARGTTTTAGAEGTSFNPTAYRGDTDAPDDVPPNRPLAASTAVSGSVSNTHTDTRSASTERTRTVRLEMAGSPYAKVEQSSELSLTLEGPDGLSVDAREDAGPVHTLYPYSYLDFSPRTDGAGGTGGEGSGTATTPAPAPQVSSRPAEAGRDAAQALADRAQEVFDNERATPIPADAILMPTAVDDGGRGVRDTAAVVIARSLGWKPPAGGERRDGYTADEVRLARAYTAERLKLDPHHTPVDATLESIALKALFSQTAGSTDGAPMLDLGPTQWNLTALPDLSGARVLDVVAGTRLVDTDSETHSTSQSTAQASATAVDPSLRPAGLTTEQNVYDKHTGVHGGALNAPLGTRTQSDSATGGRSTAAPPTAEGHRLGPAYLVEFDTTWLLSAASESRGADLRKRTTVHTGQTRNRVAAWVSQADAVRLGLVTAERARSLAAEAERVHEAADAMGQDEQDYGRERGRLEDPVRDYVSAHRTYRRWLDRHGNASEDGSRSGSSDTADWAADRLRDARQAYREQEARYESSREQYEDSTRTWVDTLRRARREFAPENTTGTARTTGTTGGTDTTGNVGTTGTTSAAGTTGTTGTTAGPAPAGTRQVPPVTGTSLRDAVEARLDTRPGGPEPADASADLAGKLGRGLDTLADLRRRTHRADADTGKVAELVTRVERSLADRAERAAALPHADPHAPTRAQVDGVRTGVEAFERDLDRITAAEDGNAAEIAALNGRRDALLAQARDLLARADERGDRFARQARDTHVVLARALDRLERSQALLDDARARNNRVRTETLNTQARHRPLAREADEPGHAHLGGDAARLGDGLDEVRNASRALAAQNAEQRDRIRGLVDGVHTTAHGELPALEDEARRQEGLAAELAGLGRPLVADALSDLGRVADGVAERFAGADTSVTEADGLLDTREEAAAAVPPPSGTLPTADQVDGLAARIAAFEDDLARYAGASRRDPEQAAELTRRRTELLEEAARLAAPAGDRRTLLAPELTAAETTAEQVNERVGAVRTLLDRTRRLLPPASEGAAAGPSTSPEAGTGAPGLRERVDGLGADNAAFIEADPGLRTELDELRTAVDALAASRAALAARSDALAARAEELSGTTLPDLRAEIARLDGLIARLAGLEARLRGTEVPEAAPDSDDDGTDADSGSDAEDSDDVAPGGAPTLAQRFDDALNPAPPAAQST
ncbi:coiled-coil domain-containing protein [Nocardiopsis protaetiae]|uniref:hypothetical protein n=1 Tax=Nocardiopsis protaetiae TaxID=3382270 RepID=UPI00387B672E